MNVEQNIQLPRPFQRVTLSELAKTNSRDLDNSFRQTIEKLIEDRVLVRVASNRYMRGTYSADEVSHMLDSLAKTKPQVRRVPNSSSIELVFSIENRDVPVLMNESDGFELADSIVKTLIASMIDSIVP